MTDREFAGKPRLKCLNTHNRKVKRIFLDMDSIIETESF